ncbi:MAG: peptidoglycan hydrolase [Bacteroidota bacterium]
MISRLQPSMIAALPQTSAGSPSNDRATNMEEAAAQFEEVLVKQFVQTMTKDLFKNSLSGENGPGWIESQSEMQSDVLADILTQRLVEDGTFNMRELLLKQWKQQGYRDAGDEPVPEPMPTTDAQIAPATPHV